jgi:hypothetical protein
MSPGDDGPALVLGQRGADHRFRRLVDGDDHHRQPDLEMAARGDRRVAFAGVDAVVERVIH